jgi:L-threonylcarbamoyladenylate synthase
MIGERIPIGDRSAMTEILKCRPEEPLDQAILAKVVNLLSGGRLVVYPATTLYGLGVSIRSESGLERLFKVKQRPPYMPYSIMATEQDIRTLVEVPETAEQLFGLTDTTITAVFKGLNTTPSGILYKGTLAVRLPCSELCRSVVGAAGPITTTSANVHGKGAPLTVEGAVEQLGEAVDLYIDGGEMDGMHTTLVDFTTGKPGILREGTVRKAEVLARYG